MNYTNILYDDMEYDDILLKIKSLNCHIKKIKEEYLNCVNNYNNYNAISNIDYIHYIEYQEKQINKLKDRINVLESYIISDEKN